MLKEYCNSGHGVGIAILMHFFDTGWKGNDSEEWFFYIMSTKYPKDSN